MWIIYLSNSVYKSRNMTTNPLEKKNFPECGKVVSSNLCTHVGIFSWADFFKLNRNFIYSDSFSFSFICIYYSLGRPAAIYFIFTRVHSWQSTNVGNTCYVLWKCATKVYTRILFLISAFFSSCLRMRLTKFLSGLCFCWAFHRVQIIIRGGKYSITRELRGYLT